MAQTNTEKVEAVVPAEGQDTVSKSEYDALEIKFNNLSMDYEKLIKAFNRLADDHNALYLNSLFKD